MLLQIFQNIRAYTLCLAPILPGIADLEVLRKAGNQIPGDKDVWCAAPAACIRGAFSIQWNCFPQQATGGLWDSPGVRVVKEVSQWIPTSTDHSNSLVFTKAF